jgi:hypothetical protein
VAFRRDREQPLEQDQVTPAIGTSPAPNYIVTVVAYSHRSAHKECKKVAVLHVRDNLTTKIDYKSEKTGFTTASPSNKNI